MEKKPIIRSEIWQDKPLRYAVLSIVVLIILAIVAAFFPHLWPLWIAVTLIAATVYFVSIWILTHKQEGAESHEEHTR